MHALSGGCLAGKGDDKGNSFTDAVGGDIKVGSPGLQLVPAELWDDPEPLLLASAGVAIQSWGVLEVKVANDGVGAQADFILTGNEHHPLVFGGNSKPVWCD